MNFWEQDPVEIADPNAVAPADWWKNDPEAEPSYVSQLGSALSTGFDEMVAGTRATFNAATNDTEDLAKNLASLGRSQLQTAQTATPADIRFREGLAAADRKWEAGNYLDAIWDIGKSAVSEPGAAVKTAVQSAPNALVSTGVSLGARALGTGIGALAGIETGPGAIGTGIAGSVAGGAVANTLMESGPAIFEALNRRTGGNAASLTDQQIKEVLDSDPTILTEGLTKGAERGVVIGLIESLGLYGAGRVASVPERAAATAARNALIREGVDVASREALEAAMANPAKRALADAAAKETADQFSTLGKVGRMTGAAGIETAASGAGEAGAQLVTEGKIAPSDVAQEMLGDLVISPAATAAAKATELAGSGVSALLPPTEPQTGQAPPVAPQDTPESVGEMRPEDIPDVAPQQQADEQAILEEIKRQAQQARDAENPVVIAATGALGVAGETAPLAPETAETLAAVAQQTAVQALETQDLTDAQIPTEQPLPEDQAPDATAEVAQPEPSDETRIRAEDQPGAVEPSAGLPIGPDIAEEPAEGGNQVQETGFDSSLPLPGTRNIREEARKELAEAAAAAVDTRVVDPHPGLTFKEITEQRLPLYAKRAQGRAKSLPAGYVREGELYVYKPKSAVTPAPTKGSRVTYMQEGQRREGTLESIQGGIARIKDADGKIVQTRASNAIAVESAPEGRVHESRAQDVQRPDGELPPSDFSEYQDALRERLGLTNFANIVFGSYEPLENGIVLRGFVSSDNKVHLNVAALNSVDEMVETFNEEALHLVFQDPEVAAAWARLKELVPAEELEALRAEIRQRGYREGVVDEEAYNEIARKLGYAWMTQPAWRQFWEAVKSAVRRIFGLTDPKEIDRVSAHLLAYALANQQAMTEADTVEGAESRGSPFRESRAAADAVFQNLSDENEASFEAFDAAKRRAVGEPPAGSRDSFTPPRFNSPEHFEAFFVDAFQRGDYAGFLEGIKASDAPTYRPLIKKLLRAAKGGDTDAAAQAEWFRHMIAGTVPADAKTQPAPSTAQAPPPPAAPTAQQAPPKPPPPPPPKPRVSAKPHVTLNTAAMAWLARKLGTIPTINEKLRRSRGRFRRADNGIDLHAQLFKDPEQAAKTLAHEIGHLLDVIASSIFGGNLVERLAPLGDYKTVFGPLWDWAGGLSNLNKVIKMEAIALSKEWRGDFDAKDRYRNSAPELYADFISAFLNDPSWTAQKAPNTTLAFLEALDQKPTVAAAYFNLVNIVKGGRLYRILAEERGASQRAAIEGLQRQANEQNAQRSSWNRAFWQLYSAVGGRYTATAAKAGGWWHNRKHRLQHFGTEQDYVTTQERAQQYGNREKANLDNQMVNRVGLALSRAGIAPAFLDRYLRNQRIIRERTATGEYLEQNPAEARAFLKWLVDKGLLGSAVQQEIDAASDDELYNLGAKIIRLIHEAQRFDDVYAEAQRVNAPPLAERGLFAFDVSGFMANPQGLTMESAAEDTKDIRDQLGAQSFADLEGIAQDYYGIVKQYALEANRLGLFKPEVWRERIEPNLDSYVPFMVLDYFTGHVDAMLRSRKGTMKDTLSSQQAGWLKTAALIFRIQRQKQALILKRFYEREGQQYGFANEMEIITDPTMDRAKANRIEHEQDVAMVGFWEDGQFKWMKFQDPAAATAVKAFDPDDLNAALSILRRNANTWRILVTTLSPGFVIRNAVRGVRTSWERFGVRNAKEAMRQILAALPAAAVYGRYKFQEVFLPRLAKANREKDLAFIQQSTLAAQYALYLTERTTPSPALQELLDSDVLTPATPFSTLGMTSDEIRAAIMAGVLAPDAMMRPSKERKTWLDKTLLPAFKGVWDFMQNIAAIQEAAPKISAYDVLGKRADITPEARIAQARMEGIPNPGVSGAMNKWMEFAYLFWRVSVQGHRATLNSAMNPRTRGGFLMRAITSELATKAFYAIAAAGTADAILRAMMGGDDNDEQVDMREAYTRLSPYKLYKDDAIPLFWLKPDGSIEWMWGHKSIPENWTPIAIRVAASEEGRWAGPASMYLMSKALAPDLAPIDEQRFAGELLGNLLPGVNPTFEFLGQYRAALFDPEPPRDSYRNRPIMPEDKWVNGGVTGRMMGITKNLMAQAGVPLMAQGAYRNPDVPAGLHALLTLPGIRSVAAADNYYGVHEEQQRRYNETLAGAAAREQRGEVTKDMARRYEALKGKGEDHRTDLEEDEYRELRAWHSRDYEGTQSRPGLMDDLRAAARAKYSEGVPDVELRTLQGQAQDSAAALEASAKDVRETLKELRSQ